MNNTVVSLPDLGQRFTWVQPINLAAMYASALQGGNQLEALAN
jgi:hypothetical protein